MQKELTPEEQAAVERAIIANRKLRAMRGLGRKTRRATIRDMRPSTITLPDGTVKPQRQVKLDDPLPYQLPISIKQYAHLLRQRKRRRGEL